MKDLRKIAAFYNAMLSYKPASCEIFLNKLAALSITAITCIVDSFFIPQSAQVRVSLNPQFAVSLRGIAPQCDKSRQIAFRCAAGKSTGRDTRRL